MRKGRDPMERRRGHRQVFAVLAVALLAALALLAPTTGWAACAGVVAQDGTRLWRAAAEPAKAVTIDYLGHSSFLIESPQGVRIVTDYNDLIRAPVTPDIVTMNHAHPTHYSNSVEPAVKYVLRGWGDEGGVAHHEVEFRDVKVRNVPTNLRDGGGTSYNSNSIFVFEMADLCIAHLGHLHHTLTKTHLAELGSIDVVMVPVDGAFTLNQPDMLEVMQAIGPKIAIPMHVFSRATLDRFLAGAAEHYKVRERSAARLVVSRAELPAAPEIIVLPGR